MAKAIQTEDLYPYARLTFRRTDNGERVQVFYDSEMNVPAPDPIVADSCGHVVKVFVPDDYPAISTIVR